MAKTSIPTHPYDVLVIGAGGAGLRAAIEARAAGATVGLVCKSLLGKAHTVMAEGGVAAALGNVAESDSWQVHFRDTMVGGKLLNEPRMAQIHAQEAPARVGPASGGYTRSSRSCRRRGGAASGTTASTRTGARR